MKLTKSQQLVVDFPYAPNRTLKVLAGPGSGKTTTFLHRVYHLIKQDKIQPNEILILSLTNKSVANIVEKLVGTFQELDEEHWTANMRDPLSQLSSSELIEQIGIYTIHGLANKVITEKEGTINIIDESGWRGLQNLISTSFWTKHNIKPLSLYATRSLEKLYNQYILSKRKSKGELANLQNIMMKSKVMTNDDLIVQASAYLNLEKNQREPSEFESFTDDLLNKYKIIIIDEFQDLYPLLFTFLEPLCQGKQVEIYGDINQSIYNFLGPNEPVIKKLEKLNGTKNLYTINLLENFRSSLEIVELSKKVLFQGSMVPKAAILSNTPKEFSGCEPVIVNIDDRVTELEYIVTEICKLVSCNVKLSDIVIMARTNSKLDIVGKFLSLYGIPTFKLSSNPDWIKDPAIQFILDIIKMIVAISEDQNVGDFNKYAQLKSDFTSVVTLNYLRGIGKTSIQNLFSSAQKNNLSIWDYIMTMSINTIPISSSGKTKLSSFKEIISPIIDWKERHELNSASELFQLITTMALKLEPTVFDFKSEHEKELFKANLVEFFRVLRSCEATKDEDIPLLKWFVQTYRDQTIINYNNHITNSNGSGATTLSTIHSAKGLEFPIAFLVGEPQSQKLPIEDKVLYVAITRARNLLYLINMKHHSLNIKTDNNSLLTNSSFWKFYNEDLKRKYLPNNYSNNFKVLKNKYGLNSGTSRRFSTHALKSTYKLIRFLTR